MVQGVWLISPDGAGQLDAELRMHPEWLDVIFSARYQTLIVVLFVCSKELSGRSDDGARLEREEEIT